MKLIIDIPDKVYGLLKYFEKAMGLADKKEDENDNVKTVLIRAVINGTPLKGHGRLIDADVLREEVNSWGMNDYEPSDFTDVIDDAPTVEAIPKDQYEARLKAEKIAVLEELRAEFEEYEPKWAENEDHAVASCRTWEDFDDIIQQKINALKGKGEQWK